MIISYDYYRIFYYTAKYKSFSKAAKILYNNQPNMTRAIKKLEATLGCKLLIRSNQGVSLTEEGKKLYKHLNIAIPEIEQGEQELSDEILFKKGILKIGTTETALHLILLDKIREFHKKHPDIQIKILNYSTPQAIEAIQKGIIDLAVVTSPLEIKKPLIQTPILSFKDVLIGGMEYQSMLCREITLAELKNFPLISLSKDTTTYQFYMQYFLDHNLRFLPDIEAGTIDEIISLTEYNLGFAFIPELLVNNKKNIRQFNLKEQLPIRTLNLITNESESLNIAAKKFISFFTK